MRSTWGGDGANDSCCVVCRFECVAGGGGGEKYVGEATELMTRVVCRFECVAGGGGEKYVGGRRS